MLYSQPPVGARDCRAPYPRVHGAHLPLFHLIVLALVQGITEFLPVSSSAHLILVPYVTGWEDQGLLLDVAVHVGTLLAVMLYFWRDLWEMLRGTGLALRGKRTAGQRMIGHLIIATIPAVLAGYLLHKYAGDLLRSVEVIAWATIGFGVLLYIADRIGMTLRRIEHMTAGSALLLGLAQVLAFIPGASRSGVTMMAARFLGYERADTARFSMLMSIPVIAGAGLLAALDLAKAGDASLTMDALIGAGLAFVSALLAIALMMRWLRRASFTPFVVYRLLLGAALLALIYL